MTRDAVWLERAHDRARLVAGACVQSTTGQWCDQHEKIKQPGKPCAAMLDAYDIAEQVGDVVAELVEPLIRADERCSNPNCALCRRIHGAP